MLNKNEREALEKILASAEKSLEQFKVALGQRHYVAGIKTSASLSDEPDTLYHRIVLAEANLMAVIAEAKTALAKK